jgi:hypothetical protein
MRRSEHGFVAVEWVAAVGFLLLPIILLVASLPVWAERQNAATVSAREAARVLVRSWPENDPDAATRVAREVAADHGVDASDVAVRVEAGGVERGSYVRVTVTVAMPAIAVLYARRVVALHRIRGAPDRRLPEPVMRERGTITLWVLGLCVALMFLGGLSLDLWRAVAARRQLSAMADSSATAGANGVDVDQLRAGTVRVAPDRARALALDALDRYPHARSVDAASVEVDGNRVTVTLRDHVDFSLLGIFLGGRRFHVEVHATSEPNEVR